MTLQKEIEEQLAIARKRLPHMSMTEVIDYVIETAYRPYERGNGGRRNVNIHRKTSDTDLLKALKRHNQATKPKPIPFVTNGKIMLTYKEMESLCQFVMERPHEGPYTLTISNKSGIGQTTIVESLAEETKDITEYDKW